MQLFYLGDVLLPDVPLDKAQKQRQSALRLGPCIHWQWMEFKEYTTYMGSLGACDVVRFNPELTPPGT